ncbi:MAG: hypothetical protein U1F40_11395 [Turneriella sp.]|nr:hypothetical protein [Turneriella sp.]HNA80646.1 hypothetical protein [Turneriella sp.]HNE21290.1 hypothetical protein [Turneriella sp.]HNL52951.1 hypothetical protein [Turneriella sp.]
MKETLRKVTSHRIFVPALVGAVALILGLLLAFEHTRNIIKIRGPYLAVLTLISVFPVFAFRFFDPHENSGPITLYFLVSAVYFISLGAPDFVAFLRAILFERVTGEAVKRLLFGFTALGACAGGVHYGLRIWTDKENRPGTFLAISPVKFAVYGILQIIYLNLFVAIARDKFGINTLFG